MVKIVKDNRGSVLDYVFAQDKNRCTPLHWAAMNPNHQAAVAVIRELAKIFREYGGEYGRELVVIRELVGAPYEIF